MSILKFDTESRFNKEKYTEIKNVFEQQLAAWKDFSEWQKQYERKKEEKNLIAYLKTYGFVAWYIYIEKNIKEHLLFDYETNQWYAYGYVAPYLWSKINHNMLEIAVTNLLSDIFTFDLYEKHKHPKDLGFIITELQQLVSIDLNQKANNDYIVMKNKVFNKKTKQIVKDCGPLDYIIQYNTVDYEPHKDCPQIKKWLNFVFKNNIEQIKLFQAICQVILFSNREYNLNFFVEIRGGGGTGKSLCGRLLQTLVGPHLRTSTNLKKLHTSPYETATLINKNLVLCPDQEAFVSGAEVLKMLTGGDPIRYEVKYKNPSQFYFHGIIVILTNAKLTYASAESAILRRRITFNFDQPIETDTIETNLLNIDNDNNISGKWESELPGFLNWVVELSPEEAISTISNYLNTEKQNVEEFSFLLWIRSTLMPFKDGELGIMHEKFGPALYKNYEQFMREQGYTPLKCPNFESNLEKDFPAAFPGGYSISRTTTKHGKTYTGLMYQSAQLPEFKEPQDQIKALALWRNAWQEKYGLNFFGNMSKTTTDHIGIDNSIFENEDLIKKLYRNKHTIQKSVGFPRVSKEDVIFNSQTALSFLKQENIVVNIDPNIIFSTFLNSFYYDPKNKIPTDQFYELYIEYCKDQGSNPEFNKKQIKQEIIQKWNNLNPSQQIKSIRNIGREKLNGILGLAIKNKE